MALFNWKEFQMDVAATAYMAEEPVAYDGVNEFDDEDHYVALRAPTRWEVWRNRNLPTFVTLVDRCRWILADAVCSWRGDHDWVDTSHGGPESGCMAGHCKRCGYSFHETLY